MSWRMFNTKKLHLNISTERRWIVTQTINVSEPGFWQSSGFSKPNAGDTEHKETKGSKTSAARVAVNFLPLAIHLRSKI